MSLFYHERKFWNLIKIYSKIKVQEKKNIKLQSHLMTPTLHVISAMRMTDVTIGQ